ncbi:hypothetical protein V6O07_14585, partial [Arthrospira platensis SPKY2]
METGPTLPGCQPPSSAGRVAANAPSSAPNGSGGVSRPKRVCPEWSGSTRCAWSRYGGEKDPRHSTSYAT